MFLSPQLFSTSLDSLPTSTRWSTVPIGTPHRIMLKVILNVSGCFQIFSKMFQDAYFESVIAINLTSMLVLVALFVQVAFENEIEIPLKGRLPKKKRENVGIFPKSGTHPPPPSPLFGNPMFVKKK